MEAQGQTLPVASAHPPLFVPAVVESAATNQASAVMRVERQRRSSPGVVELVIDGVEVKIGRGTGPCLMANKLESGGFKWPSIQDGVMRAAAARRGALLVVLNWHRVHGGCRSIAPQTVDAEDKA